VPTCIVLLVYETVLTALALLKDYVHMVPTIC